MEIEEEDRRSINGNGSESKEKLKCAICDFETISNDIYRNHLMLHATKDQESPPPMPRGLPQQSPLPPHSLPPSLAQPIPQNVNLPQYPLQIRSPIAINAEAKAAAAAAAANALMRRERPLSSSTESETAETPSSSVKHEVNKPEIASLDYLDYLKKMAPLLKHSMTPSPSPMVSSTQIPPSPPVVTGTTSELISRLYFGSMVKSLSQGGPQGPIPGLPGYDVLQKPSQTPSSHPPDADSSSGALDLSQLHKSDSSPMPSRPQSGSQTSTAGSSGKSRRKGKAYKIERKLLTDDRDSLNSGQSEYSNEHDPDIEVKSDGSSGSGKEPGTTTGNGDHHHLEEEPSSGALTLRPPAGKNLSGSHVCKFCEIAFMDSIMFTIHMGYHGFQNPFKCNMCGEETVDKVGFFLHIARKAHQ